MANIAQASMAVSIASIGACQVTGMTPAEFSSVTPSKPTANHGIARHACPAALRSAPSLGAALATAPSAGVVQASTTSNGASASTRTILLTTAALAASSPSGRPAAITCATSCSVEPM